MSAKDIKDARRVPVHFDSVAIDRGGGRSRGRGVHPHDARASSSTDPQPGPSRGGRRREDFGAALTTAETVPTESQFPALAQNRPPSPTTTSNVDPETARYEMVASWLDK